MSGTTRSMGGIDVRRYLPFTVVRSGEQWIATNRFLAIFGIGASPHEARSDLMSAAKELRSDLRANRDRLGPWMERCLRYFERKTLR